MFESNRECDMTKDQQIVYEWMFKPDVNDGTFDPAREDFDE